MFKKIEDLSKPLLLNKSATKDIRQHAIESFPSFELIADDVLPKKGQLVSYRLRSEHKTDIVTLDNDVLFFNKEQLIVPHLRLVHQYPDLLPRMQIDKGGLKHIYDGSNVMCPGLTSPGGILADVPEGTIVAIYVEGKEHAVAVGVTLMSSKAIREENKGHGIQNLHHLNDALWNFTEHKKK